MKRAAMKCTILGGVLIADILMTACGSAEKTIGGTPAVQPSVQFSEEESVSEGMKPGEEPAAAETGGYSFETGGVILSVDMDMAEVLEKLGEPMSYFEAESCAFHGLDKVYTYAGFEIDTYPQDGRDYISNIVLKDDTVATKEGISISMLWDDVADAYGDGYVEEDGMFVYERDGMKLCFIFTDGFISSIEYRSHVLYAQ